MATDPKARAKVAFRLAKNAQDQKRGLYCLQHFMDVMQKEKFLPGDVELTEDEVDSLLADHGLFSFQSWIEMWESLDDG